MSDKKTILISPLEWGLGHAARIIPVARAVHARGHRVIIATGENHIAFLKNEMPFPEYILLPGFTIRYSGIFPQYLVIIARLPSFIRYCIRDHRLLKSILRKYPVDIVISDSRIGLWNNRVKSVLILHFPSVPLPWFLKPVRSPLACLSRYIMNRFNLCFIPDMPGEINLTGELSHGMRLPENTRFIGILSRFKDQVTLVKQEKMKMKYCVILSGPEPQRRILKEKVTGVLHKTGERTIILEGEPAGGSGTLDLGKITFISHLPESEMLKILADTEIVISRSGYTTVMELASLGKIAVLVPTPGQPEQEYLADYLSEKGWFAKLSQDELDMLPDIKLPGTGLPENFNEESDYLFEKALSELLEENNKETDPGQAC